MRIIKFLLQMVASFRKVFNLNYPPRSDKNKMHRQKSLFTAYEETISWLVCGVAALFYCYEFLLRVSASIMVPQLERFYHLTALNIANLNATYYYTYLIMQIPVGILIDKFGPKKPLCYAVLLCVIGAIGFAHARSLWLEEVSRGLMGMGSAFAFVGVLKLAVNWLPPTRIALLAGLVAALGMMGAIFGDVTLTKLVQVIGWRNTISVAGIAGILLFFLMLATLKNKPSKRFYFHKHIQVTHYSLAAVLRDLPIILKNTQTWFCGIIGWFMFIPISVIGAFWGISYLRQVHHFTAEHAAWVNAMVFFGFAVGGPIAGWISDRIRSRRWPLFFGTLVSLLILTFMFYGPTLPGWAFAPLLFILGAAAGAQAIVFAIANEITERHITATAMAFVNMLVNLGGALLQPLVGRMLNRNWSGVMHKGVPLYSAVNYKEAFSILVGGLVIALILILLLKETKCTFVTDKE